MATPKLSKYSQANVNYIRSLDPSVQPIFLEFLWRIAAEGIYVMVPQHGGRRTGREQLDLYNQTPKVTWVKCPYSAHCHGLAIDLVPLEKIGPITFKAVWSARDKYERIARIALELGLEWGYKLWGTDQPHFQWMGGLTISDVAAGKWPKTPVFTASEKHPVLQRAIGRLLS